MPIQLDNPSHNNQIRNKLAAEKALARAKKIEKERGIKPIFIRKGESFEQNIYFEPLTAENVKKYLKQNKPVIEIAKLFGVTKQTIYNYKKRLKI